MYHKFDFKFIQAGTNVKAAGRWIYSQFLKDWVQRIAEQINLEGSWCDNLANKV